MQVNATMKRVLAYARRTFLAALIFLTPLKLQASHIFGADFYYTHVSGNTYTISLVMYGDCSGSAFQFLVMATPQVEIYDNNTYITTINLAAQQPYNGVEVTPVCPAQANNTTCSNLSSTIPGVKKFVYSANYTVGYTATNWRFHFNGEMGNSSQAGRSTGLTNITNPGITLIGLEATLNNTVGANSSPVYTTIPTPFYCINVPSNYNPGCVDPNTTNTLTFSLVDGYDESTNGPLVNYIFPYTAQQPLGTTIGSFSFSSTTGQMTFTPNVQQKSLVVGKVEEYNNGVLVGTSMREMTFVVLANCNNNPPNGGISNPSSGTVVNATTFNVCKSVGQFTFNINPTDQNGNTINMVANGLPSGATFTITNNNTISPSGLFSWNVTNVAPGAYTFYITYTDDGCPLSSTQTIAYTINVLPVPAFTMAMISPATCVKKAVFQVIPTGNIGIWQEKVLQGTTTIHTINNVNGTLTDSLSPGTYTIRMTNSSNCYKDTVITIAPPPTIIPQVSITNPTCPNISNGSITVTGTNGAPPYLYALGSGSYSTTNTFNNLAVGTYVLHIKDTNQCIKDTTVTLAAPNPILLNVGITRPTCNALQNGIINISAYNSIPPYTYALGSGPYTSSGTFTGLGPGTYTVHVQNSLGCIKDTTLTLTDSVQVHANIPLTNPLCYGGNNGVITVNGTGGVGPVYTYALGTGPYSTTNVFNTLTAGTYIVHVHDNAGCYLDTTVTLTQPTSITATPTVVNVTCFGAANGTASIAASGGTPPYTYNINSGPYQVSNTFNSLAPGTYNGNVQDANGCLKPFSFTILQPAAIVINSVTVTNPACYGATGSFQVFSMGGTTPYTYAVNAGPYSSSNLISGLAAGTYTIHVKDANNCIKDTVITLTQPTQIIPAAAVKKSTCATLDNGMVTLSATGGTPGYTYAVGTSSYTSSATFQPLGAGTYTFHIKDANNCIKDTIITIADSLNPSGTVAITEPLCYGQNNGIITVTPSGGTNPYTFAIGSGAYSLNNTFNSLLAGTYVIHIKDSNGCIKDTNVVVTQPTIIVPSVTITEPLCHGDANGSIVLTGAGGTPAYTYGINNGGLTSSNTFMGLTAGTNTLHIEDANGCLHDTVVTIDEPDPLQFASLDIVNVKCFGESSGTVTVNATGGTPAYMYSADANALQPASLLTGFAIGNHIIHLQDNNGCAVDTTINIIQPEPLYFAGAIVTHPTCEGATDGAVELSGLGGTPSYQYSNDNSTFNTSNVITGIPEGTFTFYIQDNNGCIHDTSITFVGLPSIIIDSTTITPASCFDSKDGAIAIYASGGVQPFSYQLGNGAPGASNTFEGLGASSYEVTAIDSHGCKKTAAVVVPQPDELVVNMVVTPNQCVGEENTGVIMAEVSGGTQPYTYLWDVEDATTQVVNRLKNGEYTVTVRDTNNCTVIATAEVKYDNCCKPYVPNAFTPNGDGKNDRFRVVFRGDMELLELSIYNRFGQQVFTTTNAFDSWDGNYKGIKADMGTYFYYIRFICGNNTTEKTVLKGDLTLIR